MEFLVAQIELLLTSLKQDGVSPFSEFEPSPLDRAQAIKA